MPGAHKVINAVGIENQEFQPQAALQDSEQPFSVGISQEYPDLRNRDRALCPLPTNPLHFPYDMTGWTWEGKAERRMQILTTIFFNDQNNPWRFSAIQTKTDGNSGSTVSQACTWEDFRQKHRTKKWERASGWNTEKMSLHFTYYTRKKMTIIQQSKNKQLTRS